jgi:PAS domain S-box-containing protein
VLTSRDDHCRMTRLPTFEEILAVLSAAAVGNNTARVAVPDTPQLDDLPTRFAIAINLLLDNVDFRTTQLESAHNFTQIELERLVAERTEQLRQSEEKFAKAFRASPAAISIATLPDGRWIEINEALAKMTGYSTEELIGHTSIELGLVDAVARAKILEAIREHGSVRNVEIQMHTKSKEIIEVLVSVERIEIHGQPCVLTIQYDITELKHAEREVRRLNADLEQRHLALEVANKELEAFSYSVAHDLRAPLRTIDGFSQMFLEDYADKVDAEGRQYLERVRESAHEMARLIDDLLMLSRVTRSELHREGVDLTALARTVLAGHQKNEHERKVEVIISDGLIANGDARLLGVVLQNLLGNAWKFSGKRPMARIEVGARQEDVRPVFFVRDNGAGFDMTYVHKLFGVFQRLHSGAEFEGTGIGLATVQRIIERHSGRIWCEAAVDQGAAFYFSLPV